jgi:D-sedoheptulose 7-phosphate isomerase
MTPDAEELVAFARAQLETSAALQLELAGRASLLLEVATVLSGAIAAGNQIMFCGNGGSASDAQHLAGELIGGLGIRGHRGFRALALTANAAVLTAIANDYDYESVFERQLSALGRRGDVLVAMSTSGTSDNVLKAVQVARQMGIVTVAFTGNSGRLKDLAEYVIDVQSSLATRVQECYMTAGHVICALVESILLHEGAGGTGD